VIPLFHRLGSRSENGFALEHVANNSCSTSVPSATCSSLQVHGLGRSAPSRVILSLVGLHRCLRSAQSQFADRPRCAGCDGEEKSPEAWVIAPTGPEWLES
jgi:hypothetical protein